METLIADSQEILTAYGFKILAALAIFIIGKWVAKILTRILRRVMEKSKVEATLISFLSNLSYAALLVFVVLAALNQLGIQTTSFYRSRRCSRPGNWPGHAGFIIQFCSWRHADHLQALQDR